MSHRKTTVFLSYASDHIAMASVMDKALGKLQTELNFDLDVIQDVRSFTQGRSLREKIISELKFSDVLCIIYTESLKKSHSWTIFEVGAFIVFMVEETAQSPDRKTDRRIVSLYVDKMPAPEQGVLGIRLDLRALGHGNAAQQAARLDPEKKLPQFFYGVSDLVVAPAA
jgi:hypothetical protein